MIRRAKEFDIDGLIALLYQADAVHHGIRPDLFKGNTPKYDAVELAAIIEDDSKPIFVYVADEKILGHAFCQISQTKNHRLLQDVKTLYIDDICVDERARGNHIATALYEFVREYASSIGCYNLTLNVWEGNDAARKFYNRLGMKPKETQMELIL